MSRYRVMVDSAEPDDAPVLDGYNDAMAYALTFDATHEVHVERQLAPGRYLCEGHHHPGQGWDFSQANAAERMGL